MALYEFKTDSMTEIPTATYAELGIREREDVQRVLREQIDIISPDTLIIAEEYSQWEDSKRRIDLLGLDRDGRIVVIELKRTEDGGHMELQALRYAAMVSTMTFDQAVEAHQNYLVARGESPSAADLRIREHLDAEDGPVVLSNQVRIVLASADFSKEITTTVLWLNSQRLDITCYRLRPYKFEGRIILDVQQVIPLPEAADFQVAIREKNLEKAEVESSGRDFTRYVLYSGGREIGLNLPKRQLAYLIVKEVIGRGVKPQEITDATPWRRSRMFVSASGNLTGSELIQAARRSDGHRYFCKDNELFKIEGKTYAFSNQWGGKRTQEALQNILALLPAGHGISYEAMS